MKAYDVQSKQELEVTAESLVDFLNSNRQVDLVLQSPDPMKTDI